MFFQKNLPEIRGAVAWLVGCRGRLSISEPYHSPDTAEVAQEGSRDFFMCPHLARLPRKVVRGGGWDPARLQVPEIWLE